MDLIQSADFQIRWPLTVDRLVSPGILKAALHEIPLVGVGWFKASSLTADCLRLLPGFSIESGIVSGSLSFILALSALRSLLVNFASPLLLNCSNP